MACHPLHIPVRVVAVKRSDVRFGDGVANAVANVALAAVRLVSCRKIIFIDNSL